MLHMFKKSFWLSCEDSTVCPTAEQAIAKYCAESGETCSFNGDDEVVIGGKTYEIYRGYENGSRGNYGIRCREK